MNRFQDALKGSYCLSSARAVEAWFTIHHDVVREALTLASRHAEMEGVAEEMAAAIDAIANPDFTKLQLGSYPATTILLSYIKRAEEALARWRKSREAGG